MSHNSTWGGDLEINAISNYYKCNVIVFQDKRPNLELQNYPDNPHVLQLAYFGSCHYNSVRGKQQVALSSASSRDTIVLKKEKEMVGNEDVEKRKRMEEARRKEEEERRRREEEEKKMERIRMEEERRREEEEKRRREEEEERRRREEEEKRMERIRMEEERRREEEEERKKQEKEERRMERTRIQEEKRREEGKERIHYHDLITRNFMILKEVEKRVAKEQHHHHHHSGEWCGDLPFNSLIEPSTQSKLLWINNEKQLRTVLHFLTMKCPCGSGSYFKYCCYPKMKAWL